jgi:hypothetical protein
MNQCGPIGFRQVVETIGQPVIRSCPLGFLLRVGLNLECSPITGNRVRKIGLGLGMKARCQVKEGVRPVTPFIRFRLEFQGLLVCGNGQGEVGLGFVMEA